MPAGFDGGEEPRPKRYFPERSRNVENTLKTIGNFSNILIPLKSVSFCRISDFV